MESALAHDLENGKHRTTDVAASLITFQELYLNQNLLKCLQVHKFLTPTKIQAAAIPMAIAGMDLLVQSKSGTGKTLIYVLAALDKIDKSLTSPQVLVIVPTRELAIQVEDTVNGLARNMHQSSAYLAVSCIGGTDVKSDRMRLARRRIVVGTPGRLIHLIQNKVLDTSTIKLLVLDEADQLYCTVSLQKDVQKLISSLEDGTQKIACSATYPDALDERLANLMQKPVLVSNSERATILLGIRQFVYELPEYANSMLEMKAKLEALHKIFAKLSYEQAILFASSQSRADSFRNYLQRENVDCELMSGAMKQSDRLVTFQAYRNFKIRVLVATDLMARGVDSSHANLVINLDPPDDVVTYLHRIGRAGRFGSKGIAITFLSSQEQCELFKGIVAEAGTGMSVLQFPTDGCDVFNFWDYASYDFPYFYKTESQEEEDNQHSIDIAGQTVSSKQQKHSGMLNNEINIIEEVPVESALAQQSESAAGSIRAQDERTNLVAHDTNVPQTQKILKLQQGGGNFVTSAEKQDEPIELAELTPSTDVPAAAPNSINTKTYCLAAPTEQSSTTLHPQIVSNTVDDASSIISDSMDNDYDSDASYSSCYSESDMRNIWQHALSQQRLLKRRQRYSGRHIYIYNRKRNLQKSKTFKYKCAKKKTDILEEAVNENSKKGSPGIGHETLWHKDQLNKLLTLISNEKKLQHLLEKCDNCPNMKDRLLTFVNRGNRVKNRSDNWIDLFYDSLCHLYYVDHSKSKKIKQWRSSSNLGNYKKLMQTINGPSCSQLPLNKLSICVNQHLNISPICVSVANNTGADGYSNHSDSESLYLPQEGMEGSAVDDFSEHNSADDDSLETQSSSGFVESGESPSSGIDTSQYDSNSSIDLESGDYDEADYEEEEEVEEEDEEEDEEEEGEDGEEEDEGETDEVEYEGEQEQRKIVDGDDADNDIYDSDRTETDSDETNTETENVCQIEDPTASTIRAHALAQARWQQLFQLQYQFIASYVNNYLATYRTEN